jgi:sarcosine oxidase
MAHIVVVGAGIVGLSVARSARQRGHEVTVLEQGPVPNPRGASHDMHRMIRYPYGAAVGYTRMVTAAFAAWDRLWADLGATHFENTGAIAISLESGDYAAQSLATIRSLALPHDVLDRAGVERLCPHLTLPANAWGVTVAPGGPLFASRIVTDLAAWLTANGVAIEAETTVVRVDEAAGTAHLADGSKRTGDLLVVAAGAWLPRLLPGRFATLEVYRQALVYVEPPARFRQSWRTAPSIAAIGDHSGYSLPDLRGAGLKFGFGGHRRRAAPDVDGFGADLATESAAILAAFRPYLNEPDGYQPLRMQVGYYVLDASRKFRLERTDRTLVVTNCDGQMFKFGPVLGERIAAMFDGAESMSALAQWAAGD